MIEFLEIFFFGQGNVQMAIAPAVGAALISGGIQVIGSIFGSGRRRRAEKQAQQEQARLQRKLSTLEANRQEITNPYSGVSNLSGLAKDLSSTLSNPYADLSVATQAAEMQIEQADISLANTLDTIRSTGASAGGATALAQAALQSKKGVSANIEQQEARNAELRAQGEQQMQQIKMSEAARLQQAQVQGKEFVFRTQEERDLAKLDRLQGMSDRYANQAAAYQQSKSAAFGQALGSLSMLGGEIYQGKVDMKIAGVE